MKHVALVLCVCIAASTSGCSSAESIARKRRDRIQTGMTQEEVRDRIGNPDTRVTGGPGEAWIYRYAPGPDSAIEYILIVLASVVLIAAAVCGRMNIPGGGGGPHCEFKVTFNAVKRVAVISPLRTVRP